MRLSSHILLFVLTVVGSVSCSTQADVEEPEEYGGGPAPTIQLRLHNAEWATGDLTPEEAQLFRPLIVPAVGPTGESAAITLESSVFGSKTKILVDIRWGDDQALTVGVVREGYVGDVACDGWDGTASKRTFVRGSAACEFTNEVGLYFLLWYAGGDEYLLQTRSLSGIEALGYLETWVEIE